jgi:FkbM family methyltransferase
MSGRKVLVDLRARLARCLGAVAFQSPRLERLFVAAGTSATRHSRTLGGLYWFAHLDLAARLRMSGNVYRRLAVGPVSLWLDVTDHTGKLHYFFHQPYEPGMVRHLSGRLRPGDVFIDIGAHIGLFSVLASHLVGRSGRVVAFEPYPESRDRLHRLADRNGLGESIEIVAAALSDHAAAAAPLFMHEDEDSVLSTLDPDHSPMSGREGFGRSIPVELTTLDTWLAARPDLRPRLAAIKIDVEGHEGRVIAGMHHTLETCGSIDLMCETSEASDADRLLKSAGFVASALDVYDVSRKYGNYLYKRPATA